MLKVKYQDLISTGVFKTEGNGVYWSSRTIDHFMGFTNIGVKAFKGPYGYAKLIYTEQFILGRDADKKECTDARYMGYIKSDLIALLEAHHVAYSES